LKSTEHANTAAECLAAEGYRPQVDKSATRTALFLENEDGVRRPLGYRDGRFVTAGANLSFSVNELLELLNDKPGRFSPNVLLRSVVQDYLLPSAAYVAGPSEIAYFAQLKTVYETFDVPQPIIFPRISMTLLTGQTAELLEDIGADATDLAAGPQELFARLVSEKLSDDVERLTAEPGREIDDIMDNLSEILADFDTGLRDAAQPVRRKIAHQIETLRKKILKVGRRKNQDLKHRIDKVYKRVFPGGAPQERILNATSFLAAYGFEFIDRLYETSDIFSNRHQVVNL
jgi:bacillithiol biosynthesis cysteine-adding enzyme BshC